MSESSGIPSTSPEPPRPEPARTLVEQLRALAWSVDPARLLVGVAAVLGLAAIGWWALRPVPTPDTPVELMLPTAVPLASAPAVPTPAEAVVHVAGAVELPGLVFVAPGGRVADAMSAAGGPLEDADLDRVNLAATVGDGDRIWIPRVGEVDVPPVMGGPAREPKEGVPQGPLDLNLATIEELDTLPGVGPATASAIVTHRDRTGRFTVVDELLEVPGIGPAKLEQLRDLVTAGGSG